MKKLHIKIYIILLISNYSPSLYSMMDMAIMMGAQEGASIANQSVNATFHSMMQSVSASKNALQNSISEFSNNMKALQKKEMQSIEQIFTQAATHINNQQGNQQKYFQDMEQYMYETISQQKPQQYYLLNKAAHLDELFSLGTMYTPRGAIWKNVFQVGNWEYDHITQSFWQMQNVAMRSQQTTSFLDKQYEQVSNSIFTEFMTKEPSYEIACQITIYQVQFPFFAGVTFNKTRWISGSLDSITKCRMFGIYASDITDIGTYFAEQYTATTKTATNEVATETLYPLEQIIQKQITAQRTLSQKAFEDIQHQPISISIRIVTSPTTVKMKAWPTGDSEPKEWFTAQSKNKDLYLYHDIGFISAGAIADFKILKPEALVFSEQAEQNFAQDVAILTGTSTKKRTKQTKPTKDVLSVRPKKKQRFTPIPTRTQAS